MSELTHKKMVLAFALLSFGIMIVGGILSGARVVTSLVRATEAALLFGLLAWILGYALVEKESDILADLHEHDEDGKGKKDQKA